MASKVTHYVIVECDGKTGQPIAGLWGHAIITNRLDKAERIQQGRQASDTQGHKWVVIMATREL